MVKKRNITMQDVANEVGISAATVSHVINQSRYVSEDLKRKVQAAIEELGYQPNGVARSLRAQKTSSIGLIIPNNANPFYAEVVRGVEKVAYQQGYSVILCNSDRDIEREVRYTELLLHRRVDGILFVGAWVGDQLEHLEKAVKRGLPIVAVDRNVAGLPISTIMADNEHGGKLATQYLLDQGHRRIACIGGSPQRTPNARRVAGYFQALAGKGIRPDESVVKRANFTFEGGYAAANELLTQNANISAIFASNDLMAIGTMRSALDQGLRVPDDVSIIGFDNIQVTEYTNPPLTTVDHAMVEMGEKAAEILLDLCNSGEIFVSHELIVPKLVIRKSVANLCGGERN